METLRYWLNTLKYVLYGVAGIALVVFVGMFALLLAIDLRGLTRMPFECGGQTHYVNRYAWGINGNSRIVKIGPGRPSRRQLADRTWGLGEYAVYWGHETIVIDTAARPVRVYADPVNPAVRTCFDKVTPPGPGRRRVWMEGLSPSFVVVR